MLPMVSLIPDESLQRLKNRFGAIIDRSSSLEIQAMVTADTEKRIDNRRLQKISGEHASDITSLFQLLVARGALIKEGHARWSWYHLPEVAKQPNVPTDFAHSGDDSVHNGDFVHSGDSFAHNGDGFLGKDDGFLGRTYQLEEIAHQARAKKRIPKQQMRSIILELCDGRWLSNKRYPA